VPATRRNFLIVEDKPFIREFLRGLLIQLKAGEIFQAGNGQEALSSVIANRLNTIDCVIADMVMSPINGLELLRLVRAGKTRLPHDICFIMVTSQKDATVVNLAVVLDVNAYMVKPVSKAGLEAALTKAFQRKWKPQSPRYYESIEVPSNLIELDD
jgi:PleD family two-component response regulator